MSQKPPFADQKPPLVGNPPMTIERWRAQPCSFIKEFCITHQCEQDDQPRCRFARTGKR
jgi:hypothetical protein